MATINDKFSKVSTGVRPLTTTVDGTRATAGGTLSCADLTGWDTDTAVHGVTYKLDGQGAIVVGSQIDFKGIVSGNTITSFTVTGGTDAGNAVGDVVQATPTARWAKDLADGLVVSLDQDGSLKAGAVDNAAALASNVVTTAKILDANITTAKIADANITTAKIADSAVTPDKMLGIDVFARTAAPTGTAPAAGTGQFYLQVGTVAVATNGLGNGTVAFPTSFANGVLTVVVCDGDFSASGNVKIGVASVTTAGFSIKSETISGSNRVNWIAIGF